MAIGRTNANAGVKPTLYAPSISLTGSTLSITDSVNNGIFVDSFKIYVGSNLLTTITTDTYDLSTELTDEGTYAINVKACGVGFNDSVVSNSVNYSSEPPAVPYLTFSSPSSFTLTINVRYWNGTLEYSTDTLTWSTWNGTTLSSVNNKLYLRGIGNTVISGSTDGRFILNGANISCTGNVENLLDYQTVALGNHPTIESNCFNGLLRDNTSLLRAPDFNSPTLSYSSCFGSFANCTSLLEPPKILATSVSSNTFWAMFFGCTSLLKLPRFYFSTNADNCCNSMFNGCTSLKVSTTQGGIYQYEWKVPTDQIGISQYSNWSTSMLKNTGGTFTGNPELNTTYYTENEPI